jgi:hypothetical protein
MSNAGRGLSRVIAVLFMLGTLAACDRSTTPCADHADKPSRNEAKVSITQGIWGDIWFWAGDFQPFCISGTVTAVSRELVVHALTAIDSVLVADRGLPFYSEIRTPLVATARSDSSGFFQVLLPPGAYSVFVHEDSLFYANLFDGHGSIWPVTVFADSVSGISFDIDYEAGR